MKIGRFVVSLLKWNTNRSNVKRRKIYPKHGKYLERLDIPYIDDNNTYHKFDIYYGNPEKKKNCCILNIHGGSYIVGDHQDSFWFAQCFIDEGYDFASLDYIPNDGKRSIKDSMDDIAKNLNCIFAHLKELGLENDSFIMEGDSAGGHFAFIFAEALLNKELANKLGYEFPKVDIKGTVLSCPVYDFVHLNDANYLTKSGMKRLFGPRYDDQELNELVSPRTHINDYHAPLFVNTCKQDFLREHSLLINEDMKGRKNIFEFIDIDSDEKGVGHVHNVLGPDREKSILVNNKIIEFMNKII